MNRSLGVAAVTSFYLCLVFSAMAFLSVPPFSTWTLQYPYWSYAEIAEGFALSAVLLFLLTFLKSPNFRVNVPRRLRWVALSFSVASGAAFSVIAGAMVVFAARLPSYPEALVSLDSGSMGETARSILLSCCSWYNSPAAIGTIAFLAAAFATLGLVVYHLEKGLASAFEWALTAFTLPAIIVFIVGLWVFAPSQMVLHVTNFAEWSLGGVFVLSNWTVLVVSASLETTLLLEPSCSFGLTVQKTKQNPRP